MHHPAPETQSPHTTGLEPTRWKAALQERTWGYCCTANWTGFSNIPLVTKVANSILSCTNKFIARSSREGILHLCSVLKATSESSVEFPSTKQTDTLEQVPWEATEMDWEVEHMSEKLREPSSAFQREWWGKGRWRWAWGGEALLLSPAT